LQTSLYVCSEGFALCIRNQSVDLQISSNPPPPAVLTNPLLNLIYDLSQENRIKY